MFFHGIILHDYRFFFEVPRFEESQDPNSSPRRGEVGRPTLRDYGGFLLSFFYRDGFQLFPQHFQIIPIIVPRACSDSIALSLAYKRRCCESLIFCNCNARNFTLSGDWRNSLVWNASFEVLPDAKSSSSVRPSLLPAVLGAY